MSHENQPLKLGMIVRSRSCPWLRGMIRRLSDCSATLVTPYGRHRVLRSDLTRNALQSWALIQLAPPIPGTKPLRGKDSQR